jgi:hypothetical protein
MCIYSLIIHVIIRIEFFHVNLKKLRSIENQEYNYLLREFNILSDETCSYNKHIYSSRVDLF